MKNKWYCTKCRMNNQMDVNRCSFCGAKRPTDKDMQTFEENSKNEADKKITQALHDAIKKLNSNTKKGLLKYLEDNYL